METDPHVYRNLIFKRTAIIAELCMCCGGGGRWEINTIF